MKLTKTQVNVLVALVTAVFMLIVMRFTSPKCKTCAHNDASDKDIVMFGRDSCPYCIKMKEQLEKDGVWGRVKYEDVENDKHAATMFAKEDADGVPYFVAPYTGKSASGSQPTVELLDALEL